MVDFNSTEDVDKRNFKVNYDGRLIYYDIAKEYLQAIALATIHSDIQLCFNLWRSFYARFRPYIPKQSTQLDLLQKKIQNLIASSKQGNARERIPKQQIFDLLNEFEILFFDASKHIWLPIQEKELDEYNFEDIIRGNE